MINYNDECMLKIEKQKYIHVYLYCMYTYIYAKEVSLVAPPLRCYHRNKSTTFNNQLSNAYVRNECLRIKPENVKKYRKKNLFKINFIWRKFIINLINI